MLFNSLTFIIFFGLTVLLYFSLKNWVHQKIVLLLASYVFYAAWDPAYVALLLGATFTDWWLAKKIEQSNRPFVRRCFLAATLCTNLGLLGYFKYSHFIVSTFFPLFPFKEIILPVGISFYTFQTLSYSLDVYRKAIKADASFADFALFVAFFPQLVAGPIVRAKYFLPQLRTQKRFSWERVAAGMSLLIVGIFQKAVLADLFLAPVADLAFAKPAALTFQEAWLGLLAFSGQIFFDFAGYSTCAIGLAACFGFKLPQNFNAPYAAIGFSDFWRRWHISLSSWLKDYLYIPLGGNQRGIVRTFLNLMITMALGGLWHGASWLFMIWGCVHGLLLVLEHGLKSIFKNIKQTLFLRIVIKLFTFLAVMLSWVWFRAKSLEETCLYFKKLFSPHVLQIPGTFPALLGMYHASVLWIVIGLLLWHQYQYECSFDFEKLPWWVRALLLSLMLILITYETGGDSRAFLYFQF